MKRRKGLEENERLLENLVSGLKDRQPVLNDPEGLTDNIMKAIRENPDGIHLKITARSGRNPFVIILTRLLAAASVCLFLLFSYEEYIVVDKLSRLEKQNAAIARSSKYQAAAKLKKVVGILSSDPGRLNHNKAFKSGQINLTTLLRAAILADVAGLTPDAFNLRNRTDYDVTYQSFMNILKKFDSTHNIIQR